MQTPAFDKAKYAARLQKLFERLNLAKVSGADIEPILKVIEKEINAYSEYRKFKKF